jgi:hypothetical protein
MAGQPHLTVIASDSNILYETEKQPGGSGQIVDPLARNP